MTVDKTMCLVLLSFVIIKPNPVKRNEIKRMLIMTLVFLQI